jgi:hypothetical protein
MQMHEYANNGLDDETAMRVAKVTSHNAGLSEDAALQAGVAASQAGVEPEEPEPEPDPELETEAEAETGVEPEPVLVLARDLESELVQTAASGSRSWAKPEPVPKPEPEPPPSLESVDEGTALRSEVSVPLDALCKTCSECSDPKCPMAHINQFSRSASCGELAVLSFCPSASSDPLTPRRTKSTPRLGRTRSLSQETKELLSARKRIFAMEMLQRDSADQRRVVQSEVNEADLKPTWDDEQIHGTDIPELWRFCGVNDVKCGTSCELKKKSKDRVRRKYEKSCECAESPHLHFQDTDSDGDDGAAGHTGTSTGLTGTGPSKGARGKVLRAIWKGKFPVAIKQVLGDHISNRDEVQFFQDLHHPHIVACHGILRQKKGYRDVESIVTERCTTTLSSFLKNPSLWERFHEEPLTADKIDLRKLTILEHVSCGLEKLHDMCVLHRDIKSLNILLDGEPGQCETCQHAGQWKICDFGEAAILKTPALSFHDARPWHGHIPADRFAKITSAELKEKNAQHYCWIHPGETFQDLADEVEEPANVRLGRALSHELRNLGMDHLKQRAIELRVPKEWLADSTDMEGQGVYHLTEDDVIKMITNPFPQGALVYSFGENPAVHDPRDSVFSVSPDATLVESDQQPAFPRALRPFSLIPTDELKAQQFKVVTLDFETNEYSLDLSALDLSANTLTPQLACLKDLYPGGIKGKISKPHKCASAKAEGLTLKKTASYEFKETKYHADLVQENNGRKISHIKAEWQCDATGALIGEGPNRTPSLWVNLSDGFIGGGRQQEGSGGNNTALQHYQDMLKEGKNYPLCVKLGTITAEGADVYSYHLRVISMAIGSLY